MINHGLFDIHGIARSNYSWKEGKTRVNIILSAALMIGLVCSLLYL